MENIIENEMIKLDDMKKESSSLKKMIKDQLETDPEYVKIKKDIEALSSRLKKIVRHTQDNNKAEIEKIETLDIEIKKSKQLISDMTIVKLFKGEKVEVKDRKSMILVPSLTVKFKKTGDMAKPERNK